MLEHRFLRKIDRYFRNNNTVFAKTLDKICPKSGQEYLNSAFKKKMESIIPKTAVIFTRPLTGYAARQISKDGHEGYFESPRVGNIGKIFYIRKIRTMPAGTKNNEELNFLTRRLPPEDDPRVNGKLKRFLRMFELDELPELQDLANGNTEFGLIGRRPASPKTKEDIDKYKPQNYSQWDQTYFTTPLGIFSLNSAVNPHRKDPLTRIRLDLFQSMPENQNIHMDTYILLRTGLMMLDKAVSKLEEIRESN